VRIGEPFHLPETKRVTKEQVADGTRAIMEQIAELLPERYRGVYGSTGTGSVAQPSQKDV
jgi:hypothetical protein